MRVDVCIGTPSCSATRFSCINAIDCLQRVLYPLCAASWRRQTRDATRRGVMRDSDRGAHHGTRGADAFFCLTQTNWLPGRVSSTFAQPHSLGRATSQRRARAHCRRRMALLASDALDVDVGLVCRDMLEDIAQ